MPTASFFAPLALGLALLAAPFAAGAQIPPSASGHGGKLLLTGGVSSIDGAAGGGLTPWAVIGSYATDDALGGTLFATRLLTRTHGFDVKGAALAWGERAELSFARQRLDTGLTGAALGLPGLQLRLDIVAAKLRLAGDAVLDSDRWWPQLALGLEAKTARPGALADTLAALGARRSGTDLYLSATKLLLAQGVLVNGTLRSTRANQNGLLGFGGTAHAGRSLQPELSLAWLAGPHLAVGTEWRAKPDNLNPSPLGDGLHEDDWRDLFIAWAPHKHASLTLAWVDLGRVVPAVSPRRQQGAYLSLQVAL